MTNEQLCEQIQAGNREALTDLYNQNSGLIYSVASRYTLGKELDDCLQEGFIGLYNAAVSYKPDRGTFSTYAYEAIKSAVLRYTTARDVHISHNDRLKLGKYKALTQDGHTATESELQAIGFKTANDLIRLLAAADCDSLDRTLNTGDEAITVGETLAAGGDLEQDAIETVDGEAIAAAIEKELAALPEGHEAVIRGIYWDGLTYEQIGERVGITANMVRSFRDRAFRQLRRVKRLREYAECYIWHGSVGRFRRTGTSTTEGAALLRYEESELMRALYG